MNKAFLLMISLISVLIAGLVSCSSDRQAVSSYRPPIPNLHRSDGSVDLKAWDHEGAREMDLEDTIDLSEAKAAQAQITTTCRFGDRTRTKETKYRDPSELKLLEIVPEMILTADVEADPAECSSTLILSNSEGAQHIFLFNYFRVRSRRAPAITLERNQNPVSGRPVLNLNELSSLRVRYFLSGTKARILCQSHSYDRLPFNFTMSLGDLDLAHPHSLDGAESRIKELCRVEASLGDRTLAVSPLIALWRKPRLKFEIDPEFSITFEQTRFFTSNKTMILHKVRVTNLENRELRFSFPSKISGAVDILFHGGSGQPPVQAYRNNSFGMHLEIIDRKDSETHLDEKGIAWATAKPGGHFVITLITKGTSLTEDCVHGAQPFGAWATVPPEVNLTLSDEQIPNQSLPLGPSVGFFFDGIPFKDLNPVQMQCH